MLGALLLITAPFVLRGLVRLHGALAYALLVDETPALRQQVSELTQSRTAAGEAEVHTLRRLERDLHDGPQQRLVRLGMDLSAAQRRLDDDPVQARALLDEALQQSQDALAEIRTLSRGIAPPILAEQGLRAAITALAARGTIPTSVEVDDVQLSDAAQNAAYFVVAEALANVEKHSRARQASVELRRVGALGVDQHHRRWDRRRVRCQGSRSVRSRRPAGRGRWDLDGVLPGGWSHAADRDDSSAATLTTSSRLEHRAGTRCDSLVPVRVVVADDSVLLREGLVRLLTEVDCEVVAAVEDAPSFLQAVAEQRPDVAIVDVRMPPDMTDDGLRAAVEARASQPDLGILMLSAYVELSYADVLLSDGRGRVGYLLKDRVTSLDTLVDALRTISAGGTVLDPEVVAQLLVATRADPLAALSPREREVLALMAEGRSNAAIANVW